jgi:hypothetical protein
LLPVEVVNISLFFVVEEAKFRRQGQDLGHGVIDIAASVIGKEI